MNERAFPSHKKMIMIGIVLLYMLFSGCEEKADYRATCTVPIGRLLLSEEWLELGVVQMNEVQEKWIRILTRLKNRFPYPLWKIQRKIPV